MVIYFFFWVKYVLEDRYVVLNFGNSYEGFRGSYNGNLEIV